jgi:transcription antitermination protein NusB
MRRRGRECALQILYQMDVSRDLETDAGRARVDEAIAAFWASFETVEDDERAFAERLVRGVVADLGALDEAVARVSQNWRVSRMGKVDRSLIRLAAYEILRCPDIPRVASINEAVEIAKRFSGKESAAFVNGVLDQLVKAEGGGGEAAP